MQLDPERKLALAYVRARRRAAVEALWRLDVTLGAVLVTGTEPMIGRIRLAWWREALERLDKERAPAEPVLDAVARHLLPAGVSGADLAAMEEGWAVLLSAGPLSSEELDLYAELRGGRLFEYSARLLDPEARPPAAAGQCWALADLARRSGNPTEAKAALRAARDLGWSERWPPLLRPLGMLATLARRDARRGLPLEGQGSPARMLRMLGHRLTGR
jgi:phytoene synthase